MTVRRPIVRSGGGSRQLPPGDRLAGLPALRVHRADGSRAYIPLDENGELPALLAGGALTAIPVAGVTYG